MNSIFKALNDPTRREILQLLQERDMTAGEIVERFKISGPSISHHLDLLKQAKLVLIQKMAKKNRLPLKKKLNNLYFFPIFSKNIRASTKVGSSSTAFSASNNATSRLPSW